MLREDVEAARSGWLAVQFMGLDAEDGGLAFQDFETVGGNQYGFRRLVDTAVGAADTLQQPGNALGCANLDNLSTPPRSMPRSSDEVATTARRLPAAMAASTLRRCSTSRSRDGARSAAWVSFSLHSAWNMSSGLGAGVDEDDGHGCIFIWCMIWGGGFQAHVAGP